MRGGGERPDRAIVSPPRKRTSNPRTSPAGSPRRTGASDRRRGGESQPLKSAPNPPFAIVRALVLPIVLLAARPAAFGADTATLHVKAEDTAHKPLPGIVVEIRNDRGLPVPRASRTDASGTASFTLIAGSGYTARLSGAGMAEQTSDPFTLDIGAGKTLIFTLRQAIVEKVQVKSRPVELDEGGEQKVTFSSNFTEDLPILGRSYQNVLALAPGVNDPDKDGNPNVHGARERDFKATVDGVSNVDPLTGFYMSDVNADAIEEVEIVPTGASAEYGGAVGGFGKIITKQGTNVFSGSASIYVRSSVLDGNTVVTGTDSESITYHDVRPSLNLTGPIVKDQLFFALFHEYLDEGTPVNALGGTGFVVNTTGTRNLDKVTWQVSGRNKLTFQAQSDPLRTSPLGLDSVTAPESGYAYEQGGPIYQIHWDAQASSVFAIQSLIGYSNTGVSILPTSIGQDNGCVIDLDARSIPSARHDIYGRPDGIPIDQDYCLNQTTTAKTGSYNIDYADQRKRYTVKSDGSYFLDSFLGFSHTFRAGIIAQWTRYEGWNSNRPYSVWDEEPPTLGNGGVIGNGVIHRTVYVPGQPDSGRNRAEGSNFGVYFEDQFRPTPNLSIRVGLRVDQENLSADGYEHFDPLQEAIAFEREYRACILGNPRFPDRCARASWHVFHKYEFFPIIGISAIRPLMEDQTIGVQPRTPETFRISNNNPAPRFSISWDPHSDGRAKIFATAGRYYGETFLAVPAFEQGPDTFLLDYPVFGDTVNCRPHPTDPNALICDNVSYAASDGDAKVASPSIRQVDRNLKTPYQDEYTAGFSWEIFRESSLTVTYIERQFRDQLQDVDINHLAFPFGRRNGPEARIVLNPFFNEILRVGNFNQSDYRAWQFEFVRRLYQNWELEASYVWSKATGNAEDYNQTVGNDPGNVQSEYGYLDYDQRNVVKLNMRTQIPSWNVRLSGSIIWASGRPYSITRDVFAYDIPRVFGNTVIGFGNLRTWYPTGARNDQRNAGYWQVAIGIRKDFPLGRATASLSADIFNAMNEDTLTISGVSNGVPTGTRLTGRQFQVGAKIAF